MLIFLDGVIRRECQCDVININSFHEILTYLFQILATPLYTVVDNIQWYFLQ